mgnify:CR=1 FL=1
MTETLMDKQAYPATSFVGGKWQQEINVRDFIQKNYTPYDGDSSFLAEPTGATTKLWQECCDLLKKEFAVFRHLQNESPEEIITRFYHLVTELRNYDITYSNSKLTMYRQCTMDN